MLLNRKRMGLIVMLALSLMASPGGARPREGLYSGANRQVTGGSVPSVAPIDATQATNQKIARRGSRPTKIGLMPYRYFALQEALAGYRRAKVPLVAFDGTNYLPAGFSDDPGIYYFIPRLAVFADISWARASDLFFGAILLLSFLAGIVCVVLTIHSPPLKSWAVLALILLLWFSFRKGDVYMVQSASAVAVVPWFLHLLSKRAAGIGAAVFLFAAGLSIGFANLIRSHAATGLAIFIGLLIVFELRCARKRKLALLCAMFAGILIATVWFDGLRSRRDAFLQANQPEYIRPLDQHPFWHIVYAGFGFTKNPYVRGYGDEVPAEKVRSISPSAPYLSPEYERILRTESLRLAREHPGFVFTTILAKFRIIIFLLLCWSNAGLLASALYPKSWPVELAFGSALAFNSLFGILALPAIQYLLGFMAFATLYGIVSLAHALEHHQPGQVRSRLRVLAKKVRLA